MCKWIQCWISNDNHCCLISLCSKKDLNCSINLGDVGLFFANSKIDVILSLLSYSYFFCGFYLLFYYRYFIRNLTLIFITNFR